MASRVTTNLFTNLYRDVVWYSRRVEKGSDSTKLWHQTSPSDDVICFHGIVWRNREPSGTFHFADSNNSLYCVCVCAPPLNGGVMPL